jgi:hypothetical protein
LAEPPGATLVILDNMGWYCDIEKIVFKTEESLNFVKL